MLRLGLMPVTSKTSTSSGDESVQCTEDTATSQPKPTQQEAVSTAASLGRELLAVYPDTSKTCCLYAVGLGDAKHRLTQAVPDLDVYVDNLQEGSPFQNNHSNQVHLSPNAAIGVVYTAAQRLQDANLFQNYPSLQSQESQAHFKSLETYCKNTPGTIPTKPF